MNGVRVVGGKSVQMTMEGQLENSQKETENTQKLKIKTLAAKILGETKDKEEPNQPISFKSLTFGKLIKLSTNNDGISENEVEFNEVETKQIIRLQEIEDDIKSGNLYTQEDYDRIYYESPLVKQLKITETTEDLYKLADTIVGPLKKLTLPF